MLSRQSPIEFLLTVMTWQVRMLRVCVCDEGEQKEHEWISVESAARAELRGR